jgi:hypothetical protein
VDRQDYKVVRQFSSEGKELNAYLARSTFPPGLEPGTASPGVRIEVTTDRVGILANSGKSSLNQEWVELDLNGNVIQRSRTDDTLRSVHLAVFTSDDHVFLQSARAGEVYTLDHASQTWKPTQNWAPAFSWVPTAKASCTILSPSRTPARSNSNGSANRDKR